MKRKKEKVVLGAKQAFCLRIDAIIRKTECVPDKPICKKCPCRQKKNPLGSDDDVSNEEARELRHGINSISSHEDYYFIW